MEKAYRAQKKMARKTERIEGFEMHSKMRGDNVRDTKARNRSKKIILKSNYP